MIVSSDGIKVERIFYVCNRFYFLILTIFSYLCTEKDVDLWKAQLKPSVMLNLIQYLQNVIASLKGAAIPTVVETHPQPPRHCEECSIAE